MNQVELISKLISFPSVTPHQAGSLNFIADYLKNLNFTIITKKFGEVDNLYAEIANTGTEKVRNLCFAGHVDVVPPGPLEKWLHDPFEAYIKDGIIYGRGIVDMKGAISCFMLAVKQILENPQSAFYKSAQGNKISFLLTSDEEGPARDGTLKMLEFLQQQNIHLSHAIVGEPTSPNYVGEMIKNGRRGSISFHITINGKQGHVAYPTLACNPIDILLKILTQLKSTELDKGSQYFTASNLEIVNIEVNNPVTNVIPAMAKALINIRFNDLQDFIKLEHHVKKICEIHSSDFQIMTTKSADSFLCANLIYSELVSSSIEQILAKAPILSTEGGTSDARFIKNYCPVIEFGLVNKTAHQINESVAITELDKLTRCYKQIIDNYFLSDLH